MTFLRFISSNKEFTIFTSDLQSVKGEELQEKKNEINAHHDHVKVVAELKGLEMQDWEEQLLQLVLEKQMQK